MATVLHGTPHPPSTLQTLGGCGLGQRKVDAMIWHPSVNLHIYRETVAPDVVHWTLSRTWYEGDAHPREARKYRHVVQDEGSFVQKQEIRDVRVLVREVAETIDMRAHGRGAARHSGGRERSGIENIPLPLAIQTQEPLADTTEATEDPA
jgi:hypothetical protein